MARYSSSRLLTSIARGVAREAKRQARALEQQRKELERQAAREERALESQRRKSVLQTARDQEKLRKQQLARLEVQESENQLELLLSLHKECSAEVDWRQLHCELYAVEPEGLDLSARREWRKGCLSALSVAEVPPALATGSLVRGAEENRDAWERRHELARGVLEGEGSAYVQAINEYSALDEIAAYGSSIEMKPHSAQRFEVVLELAGPEAIPESIKTLLASGRASVKKLSAKARSELYQDHLCSCMLRVAREVFAILPVDELLLTATVPMFDPATGNTAIAPAYSVILSRKGLEQLNFDSLDPSDAIEAFPHNGDFKTSRKSGAFQPVTPLTFSEVGNAEDCFSIHSLREDVQRKVAFLKEELGEDMTDAED